MKRFVLIAALACVLPMASLAQRYTVYGRPGSSGSYTRIGLGRAGGPPLYSGSTRLLSVAVPTPPNVGNIAGAGTIFYDPVYGTKGVRLTDACFDPSMVKASAACPNGTAVSDNSNNSYDASQSGSADDLEFNTGDFLTIVANHGARHYLVGFDKNTLALSRPYSAGSSTGGWSTAAGLDFSLADPCKLYATSGTAITSYTFGSDVVPFANPCSGAISGPPAPATVVNLIENLPASCVGTACNCLPSDFGSPTWTVSGGESLNDALFARGFSSAAYSVGGTGQGTGIYIAIYSPTKGCMSYNTGTGAIQADLGWSGGAGLTCNATQCSGTSTAGSDFTLHNVKMNKSGNAIAITPTTNISGTACSASNPWIWVPGTTTVYCSQGQPGNKSSGHYVLGSQGMINDPGSPLYQFWYRLEPAAGPSGTPVTVNNVPSCGQGHDQHSSYQSADANDTWPFLQVRTNANVTNSGLPTFDPTDCAWVNELTMVDMAGSRQVHRMAFTFATGFSPFFSTQWGIAELSPSGRFASASSEWLNTLRNAAGSAACSGMSSPTSTCIPNGPAWKSGKTYATGYIINPTSNNGGNYSYQATVGGTSATQPLWSTNCATVGSTCSDNGITWTNVGVPSGVNVAGTDAFLWDLQN